MTRRLRAEVPEEVMPLVDEVNALLDAQEQTVERARAWTADLAHGLKTPLTALGADAQRLRHQGNVAMADELEQLAETMRRRVDRELIRARMRSGVRTRQAGANVGDAIARVVRTLQRTPRGGAVAWTVEVQDHGFAAIDPDDLTELVGNLLDNAVKWATARVWVSATSNGGVDIQIEDDGPGVSDDQLERLCQRGVRLDQGKKGSGLGLAIAHDITDAYGGELRLDRAALGGLQVSVRLPSQGSTPLGPTPASSKAASESSAG
jgi:signal transduction histidine kinase